MIGAVHFAHEPVLMAPVVDYLAPRSGSLIVDATVGGGGHAEALLARGARVIGLDRDPEALAEAAARLAPFGSQVTLLRGNFGELCALLDGVGATVVDGVLFDLGVSSHQLDDPRRGFTYRVDAPLDMRLDPDQPTTAYHLVNGLSAAELAGLIRRYGEEPWANRIAEFIVAARKRSGPVETTGQLVSLIQAAIPAAVRRRGGHPARRTFQALRIAVNDELHALETGLAAAKERLARGGRLVAISFHSLEDRRVKQFFRDTAGLGVLTAKPVTADAEELTRNPRSRSAKLRAAERLDGSAASGAAGAAGTPTCR